MNKQKVLVISGLGLLAIVVVWLFINAVSKSGYQEDPQISGNDAMTNVPTEYTYKDMMEAQKGNELDYADTLREKHKAPFAADVPDFAQPIPPADDNNNIKTAIQQVSQVRQDLKDTIPAAAPDSDLKAEEEILKRYAQRQPMQSKLPNVQPSEPSSIAPAITQPAQLPQVRRKKAFNSMSAGDGNKPASQSSVRGVILNDVVVNSGYSVSIMLLESVNLVGFQLPKNKVVTGIASVQSPRLKITVPGTEIAGSLTAVSFEVYDTDGLEGLKVLDNSAGSQVNQTAKDEVSRGIDAAAGTGVVGGVVRVIKSLGNQGNDAGQAVKIPGGHKVLLKVISNG